MVKSDAYSGLRLRILGRMRAISTMGYANALLPVSSISDRLRQATRTVSHFYLFH
ncbi:hypothetical protein [Cylindrospermum stagnale]|uniref:hypothetical protein n=1 Tax=Cylindrospermum stagnale TaxID=142864 RepID=UPI0012F67357|nr:hypothetical protein [Cylindrospermum stagnale]